MSEQIPNNSGQQAPYTTISGQEDAQVVYAFNNGANVVSNEIPDASSSWENIKDKAPFAGEQTNESGSQFSPEQEKDTPEKSFTESELERIAKITGRTPDDPGVIELNLVLRAQEYQRYVDIIEKNRAKNASSNTKTTLQLSTLEDAAAAKRALEEAMFLYDPTFKDMDDKMRSQEIKQHLKNEEDRANKDKHFGEGEASAENSWVRARIERENQFKQNRERTVQNRADRAEELSSRLGDICKEVEKSEIYNTYELLNKEDEPNVRDRRNGFNDVGKNGFYDPDTHQIDLTLYPHAPTKSEKAPDNSEPQTPEQPDNPTQPEAPETPIDNPDRNALPPAQEKEPHALPPAQEKEPHALPPAPEKEPHALPPAQESEPLKVVMVDNTELARARAKDEGKKRLEDELTHIGFFKKIWKGNFARRYYEKKYEQQVFDQIMRAEQGEDVGEINWNSESDSKSQIEHFVKAEVNDYLLHKGESLQSNPEASARVSAAIKKYATIPENATPEELEKMNDDLDQEIKRICAEVGLNTEDSLVVNNARDVAERARTMVMQGQSIENVMDGFTFVFGEAHDAKNTEAHRDSIDKIVDKLESSRFGRFIPPELIAGAAGTALALAQTGSNIGLKAAAGPLGGILGSGFFAAVRERFHVNEDRVAMSRAIAGGEKPGDSKYDAKMAETIYDMQPAQELIDELYAAKESGDQERMLRVLTEIEVRRQYGQDHDKDLISYEGFENAGAGFDALAEAMFAVKQALDPTAIESYDAIRQEVATQSLEAIQEDISNKDKAFKSLRRRRMAIQFGKTVVVGAATMIGTQEIFAMFNPNSYGAVEHLANQAGVHTENANTASNTILANIFGINQAPIPLGTGIASEEAAKQLAGENGTITSRTETYQDIQRVNASNYQGGTKVNHLDWGSNGTTISDGNELRVYNAGDHGYVCGMFGNSTTWNGQTLDYQQLSANNQIFGFLYPTDGSTPIKIPGKIVDGQMVFESDILSQFKDSTGFHGRFFEVAASMGVDANGVEQIIPLATDVGDGTVTSFNQTVEAVRTVYDVVRPRATELFGLILPFVGRKNLSPTEKKPNGPETPPETPASPPSETPPETPVPPTPETPSETSTSPTSETPPETPPAPAPQGPQKIENPDGSTMMVDVNTPPPAETASGGPMTPDEMRAYAEDQHWPEDVADMVFGGESSNQYDENSLATWWNSRSPAAQQIIREAIARGDGVVHFSDNQSLTLSPAVRNYVSNH